jgi:hypothetical protein
MLNSKNTGVKPHFLVRPAIISALLLLVPFLAQQFNDQVEWAAGDFVAAGLVLFMTGVALEFTLHKTHTTRQRVVACVVAAAVLTAIWVELAVGIFATPFAGN